MKCVLKSLVGRNELRAVRMIRIDALQCEKVENNELIKWPIGMFPLLSCDLPNDFVSILLEQVTVVWFDFFSEFWQSYQEEGECQRWECVWGRASLNCSVLQFW